MVTPLTHLRALLLPSTACAYLAVWPEPPIVAVLWALLPFTLRLPGDRLRDQAAEAGSPGPLRPVPTLTLYALAVLQLVNLALTVSRIATHGVLTLQTLGAMVLLCVSSVVAGAVTGHELIHSKRKHEVWLGRLLLATILYEHFHTEHLHGHHARYATADDPATARYGEAFTSYLRRTVPAQWRSAWRLESQRLRDRGLSGWRHRVLQGLVLEAGLAGALLVAPTSEVALAVFVTQAVVVQVVFSAVQYFQHWGLVRVPGRELPHSWDGQDRVSFVNLLGLSRHSDHHTHPDRSFEHVAFDEHSPRLPYPYSVMVFLAIARNARFQELMTAELARCGLAPERAA